MNNKFDWNRFCKVVNKDFRNLWPMFGTTAIVLATLPFAIWLLALVLNRNFVIDPNYRVVMLMGFSSLAALMLPSRLYRTMNLRNEGIYYAMLPASKLEKFLSMLLFTFIVAPVVVYLGSIPMDDDTIPGFHSWLLTAATYTSYLASPAIFLYAATLFKKHKVLYTFLILYLIEFVLTIIAIPVIVSLAQKPDFVEWVYDFFNLSSPERIFNNIFGIAAIFNTIIFVLFIWMAWRRLKKMPY